MKVHAVIRIGRCCDFPFVVAESIASVFPEATITQVPDSITAQALPFSVGLELLITGTRHTSGEVPLEDMLDAQDLPRWAVLRFGGESGSIPVEDWGTAQLASLLAEAAARHRHSREKCPTAR